MAIAFKITPNLWFDTEAEEAAKFYTSVFPNSQIGKIIHYGNVGQEVHGKEPGSVMTVTFELSGQPFLALNGGPELKFNEAVSFEIDCESQEEVDYYWNKLSEGGDDSAQQCGWLKDRFGLSWQVVPLVLNTMLADPDPAKSEPVMKAMLQMKKIEISELQKAYSGG